MSVADPDRSRSEALEPQLVDDPTRRVTLRVLEHASGVERPTGLMFTTPASNVSNRLLCLGDGPLDGGESRLDHEIGVAQVRMPVAQVEIGRSSLADARSLEVEDPDGDEHIAGLGAVAAGIHPYCPADRAGDAGVELQSPSTRTSRVTCQQRQRNRSSGHGFLPDRSVAQPRAGPEHHSREAGVSNHDVAAASQGQDR